MKIDLHFVKSTVASLAVAGRRLGFKLICSIAALALSSGIAAAQTTRGSTR
jgi:hypothetical protein